MQISKKVNKSAIFARIWTKFGTIVGDHNPDKFWKNIIEIRPLTNFMNIFVKILHYGYRLSKINCS